MGVFDAQGSLVRFTSSDWSQQRGGGGGGNIGWYAIRLQILTANTQLTSVELFANCRLDWSLLKTMVDC